MRGAGERRSADRSETPAAPFTERLHAVQVVGRFGDPRFPVTPDEWRAELARRNQTFGQPPGYFCYVPGGAYRVGGWDTDQASAEIDLQPFWIARYPITVAQYHRFIADGGYATQRWWTPQGWKWKGKRTQPWGWDDADYNSPNQPVIGVSWYEATALCVWLSAQVGDALPEGYAIRLSSEAEWEAAAAYDAAGKRRAYPWGEEEPTPERAITSESGIGRTAAVGACPAGAAACGALDLAGNVWEWTASGYRTYPEWSAEDDFGPDDYVVAVRGGAWRSKSTDVRCGARGRRFPDHYFSIDGGVRVCLSPRSYKGSEF